MTVFRKLASSIASEWDGRPETREREVPVLRSFLIDRIERALVNQVRAPARREVVRPMPSLVLVLPDIWPQGTEESEMAEKPSKRYLVEGVERRGHFVGRFAFPGKPAETIVGTNQRPIEFETEDAAIAEAGVSLCEALNGRMKSTLKYGYVRMSGAELAVALADLAIRPSEFAILYGTQQKRVMSWIDGEEDIPHPVRILLALFAMPGALSLARQITAASSFDRRDQDETA